MFIIAMFCGHAYMGTIGVAGSYRAMKTGYVDEAYVKKLAATAGFRFDAESPVNDNPQDTKDYPEGVWTLPPTLTLGDKDRAKYAAIGESDRMTLRFVKPGK